MQDIRNAPDSPPRLRSPIIQLIFEQVIVTTQGVDVEEMIEEIPNTENVKARVEGSGAQDEKGDDEIDRSIIIFNKNNDLLFYFLPVMSQMKAFLMGDLTYITWTYQKFPDAKVVSKLLEL